MSVSLQLQLHTGQTGPQFVGNDLNVEPVWIQGITGCNSVVAIVDDGEYVHVVSK